MSDGLTKRKSPKDSGDGKEVKISTAKREMPKESIDRRKMGKARLGRPERLSN